VEQNIQERDTFIENKKEIQEQDTFIEDKKELATYPIPFPLVNIETN